MAVVLLVLRAVAGGIVSVDDDVSTAHTHVSGGEQGVSGHIQAHHFHGGHAAAAGHGSAVSHFRGDLLIGSPLAVQTVLVLGQLLQNFGAGRSGISGSDLDTGFVDATRDGFVTGHQMFHDEFHLSIFLS